MSINKRIRYAMKKEKQSLDFIRTKKRGNLYVIIIDLVLFVVMIYLIVFSFFPSTINAVTITELQERQLYLPDVASEDSFSRKIEYKETKELSYKKALYSVELAEELKDSAVNKVYEIAKKDYKCVEKKHIEMAYDICAERLDTTKPLSMGEFLELFAINVTIMEIESGFDEDLIGHNPTTKDYGIMQVNSSVIETAEKELGVEIDVLNLYDNVNAGSWEVYTCFSLAKEKHPDNVLWWTYVYYNRGLYVENTKSWKTGAALGQANRRSKIFIDKFNKYYSCL